MCFQRASGMRRGCGDRCEDHDRKSENEEESIMRSSSSLGVYSSTRSIYSKTTILVYLRIQVRSLHVNRALSKRFFLDESVKRYFASPALTKQHSTFGKTLLRTPKVVDANAFGLERPGEINDTAGISDRCMLCICRQNDARERRERRIYLYCIRIMQLTALCGVRGC